MDMEIYMGQSDGSGWGGALLTDCLEPVLCVVMVSTVRRPMVTRAGIASTEIQKATQDRMTIRTLGTYN